MTEHGWTVPMWAYVVATVLLPFWFLAITAAKCRETFADRLLAGSLLHGVVWISVLFDRGLGDDAGVTFFATHLFGSLFYLTADRRAAHGPDD